MKIKEMTNEQLNNHIDGYEDIIKIGCYSTKDLQNLHNLYIEKDRRKNEGIQYRCKLV